MGGRAVLVGGGNGPQVVAGAGREPEAIAGLRFLLGLPGDLATRIQSAASPLGTPGVVGSLQDFANPAPTQQRIQSENIRQKHPEFATAFDAATGPNGDPNEAQRLVTQLGATMAAHGEDLSALAPMAQQVWKMQAQAPGASPSGLQQAGMGAGTIPADKGPTGLALILQRGEKSKQLQAQAGAEGAQQRRWETLTPVEAARARAQTGQAAASAGLEQARTTTENTLRAPRQGLLEARTGQAARSPAGRGAERTQLTEPERVKLRAMLTSHLTGQPDDPGDARLQRFAEQELGGPLGAETPPAAGQSTQPPGAGQAPAQGAPAADEGPTPEQQQAFNRAPEGQRVRFRGVTGTKRNGQFVPD